jgi:hypothetical protein
MTIGYRMEEKPDKSDIEIQRNSEFKPQWYVLTSSKLISGLLANSERTVSAPGNFVSFPPLSIVTLALSNARA